LSKDLDATERTKDVDSEQSTDGGSHPDLFEENFLELKKWVDVKSSKYGILTVTRERRSKRLGTALKVFSFQKLFYLLFYG
jgi:tripeptidyl-peptidase-2